MFKNCLPAVTNQIHGTETVKEISYPHEVCSYQRSGKSTMYEIVHFLGCNFFMEEASVIGAVSKQRHILCSDCARELHFLHSFYASCFVWIGFHRIVITTFRIDKNYNLVYVLSF